MIIGQLPPVVESLLRTTNVYEKVLAGAIVLGGNCPVPHRHKPVSLQPQQRWVGGRYLLIHSQEKSDGWHHGFL